MFNVIINSEQYDEFMAQKEKIKELEARNEFLKEQYDQLNEKSQSNSNHYQGLYEELVQTVHEKEKTLESLYKNYQRALSDKVALIKECDDLRIKNKELEKSIDDLRTHNKEIKAMIDYWKEQFDSVYDNYQELKIKKPVATITINPYRDLEDVYSPDNNSIINIKNLCFTNNYFSEENERND